jgi:hypothetical protein
MKWEHFFPSGNHANALYTRFHYDLFPQYNEIMRTHMKGIGTLLEAALQVELRPDGRMIFVIRSGFVVSSAQCFAAEV